MCSHYDVNMSLHSLQTKVDVYFGSWLCYTTAAIWTLQVYIVRC